MFNFMASWAEFYFIFFHLQKEYTSQNCQTVTSFKNILPFYQHVFFPILQFSDASNIEGFIMTVPSSGHCIGLQHRFEIHSV